MIQEGFPINPWVARLADDERRRDAVVADARQSAAREAAFVLTYGRGLVASLAATIGADVERFRQEFPEDPARHMAVDVAADGGFEVRRSEFPTVALNVTPQWTTATVNCRYRFTPSPELPTREDRFALVFVPVGDEARFKHQGSGQLFADVPALSEYLLTPVFTGRPRVG